MKVPVISLGGRDVISAGLLTYFANEKLLIRPTGPGDYFVEFRFTKSDEANSRGKIEQKNSGKGVIIELTDFDLPNGAWNTVSVPLYVANHNGKRMMLVFGAALIGKNPPVRQFSYTFFEGDALNG